MATNAVNGGDGKVAKDPRGHETIVKSSQYDGNQFFCSLLESSESFATILADLRLDTSCEAGDQDSTNAATTAAVLTDQVEIRLRPHVIRLLDSVLCEQKELMESQTSTAMSELGAFWSNAVRLCQHWISCHVRYERTLIPGSVKKIPFTLLDDILDGLPVLEAQTFWKSYLDPLLPDLLRLESSSNFIFLKTCNGFWKRCCLHGNTDATDGGSWAARIMQTLTESFPLGERSAARVWGSRNVETISDFESSDTYQHHVQLTDNTTADSTAVGYVTPEDGKATMDYNFYQSLWSLQHDFSSPFIKIVGVFLARVKGVLDVLEATPVVEGALGEASLVEDAATGPYLTHGCLLAYQLQDPSFRAHFLTQFLIVAHHVTTEAPAVGSQLEESRKRANLLLDACSPQLLDALNHLLATAEPQWSSWKKNKCPDLDTKRNEAGDTVSVARKRARFDRTAVSSVESVIPSLLDLTKDLPTVCRSLQGPSLEQHLDAYEYIDALDPDAGIEDEYHPKSNPYFCWQALRLLPVNDLDKVQYTDGDFEGAVRHIWKRDKSIDIPGDRKIPASVPEFELTRDFTNRTEDSPASEEKKSEIESSPVAGDDTTGGLVKESSQPHEDNLEGDRGGESQASDATKPYVPENKSIDPDGLEKDRNTLELEGHAASLDTEFLGDQDEGNDHDNGDEVNGARMSIDSIDSKILGKSGDQKMLTPRSDTVQSTSPTMQQIQVSSPIAEKSLPRDAATPLSRKPENDARGQGNDRRPPEPPSSKQQGPKQSPSQHAQGQDKDRRGGPTVDREQRRQGYHARSSSEMDDIRRDKEQYDDHRGDGRSRRSSSTVITGGGPPMRDDRGGSTFSRPPPPGRTNDRGPPPGRNVRMPTLPSRDDRGRDDRWSREDRRGDRRDGAGESGGAGSRAISRDGRKPRR